jgi:hypothetical protein
LIAGMVSVTMAVTENTPLVNVLPFKVVLLKLSHSVMCLLYLGCGTI